MLVMRRAVQLTIAAGRLFGTYHERPDNGYEPAARPGLVLMGFGQQPRSWVGDLGAAIADRVALAGYPAFRFDMPGLGDSPGDLPVHLEVLWRDIQTGSHQAWLNALCHKLENEYALNGVVVGGFCGGAVTALFSTSDANLRLRGLLLLEPEFALTNTDATGSLPVTGNQLSTHDYLQCRENLLKRLVSPAAWGHLLTGHIDRRFWSTLWKSACGRLSSRFSGKDKLPVETNHHLLEAWQLARKRSIPTLVVSVGTATRAAYYKAYGLAPGRDQPRSRLRWIEVPRTTHALLAGGAKEAVCGHVVQWFERSFA